MHKTLVVRKNEKEKGKCIKMTLWVASEQEIVLILTKNETMLVATKKCEKGDGSLWKRTQRENNVNEKEP